MTRQEEIVARLQDIDELLTATSSRITATEQKLLNNERRMLTGHLQGYKEAEERNKQFSPTPDTKEEDLVTLLFKVSSSPSGKDATIEAVQTVLEEIPGIVVGDQGWGTWVSARDDLPTREAWQKRKAKVRQLLLNAGFEINPK